MVEPVSPKDPEEGESTTVALARYSGLGLQLAGSVGLFLAAGWWVDGKLGTRPLLTIVGALVGAAAGFYALYLNLTKDGEAGSRRP
jgi:F0F1-type ATP synthase assembly protein I